MSHDSHMTVLLFQVCQHPHSEMRGFAAGALTMMVKAALTHQYDTPLHQQPVSDTTRLYTWSQSYCCQSTMSREIPVFILAYKQSWALPLPPLIWTLLLFELITL